MAVIGLPSCTLRPHTGRSTGTSGEPASHSQIFPSFAAYVIRVSTRPQNLVRSSSASAAVCRCTTHRDDTTLLSTDDGDHELNTAAVPVGSFARQSVGNPLHRPQGH